MPKANDKNKEDKVFFNRYDYMLHLPFVMYADFESILKRLDHEEGLDEKSWTVRQQSHQSDGFAVYTKCIDPAYYKEPYIYTGENSAERFLDYVIAEAMEIRKIYQKKVAMKRLDREQFQIHREAEKCYLCKSSFITNNLHEDFHNKKKVADHCHLTGKYRGAAHSICNLKLKINPEEVKIPVIIHNLRGYDSHLILSAVKRRHGDISCIPNNMEKYTSFSVGGVTFLDSCQFMQSSLSQLTDNLRRNESNNFHETRKYLIHIHGTIQEQEHQQQQPIGMMEEIYDETVEWGDFDDIIDELGDYRFQPYIQPTLETTEQERKVGNLFRNNIVVVV